MFVVYSVSLILDKHGTWKWDKWFKFYIVPWFTICSPYVICPITNMECIVYLVFFSVFELKFCFFLNMLLFPAGLPFVQNFKFLLFTKTCRLCIFIVKKREFNVFFFTLKSWQIFFDFYSVRTDGPFKAEDSCPVMKNVM